MPGPRVQEVERAYFVRKLAGSQAVTLPFNQLKREYFIATNGAASGQVQLDELEKRWLCALIGAAGGTVNMRDSESELWKKAVLSISLVPSLYMKDNKIKFYLNAP